LCVCFLLVFVEFYFGFLVGVDLWFISEILWVGIGFFVVFPVGFLVVILGVRL